MRYAFLHKNFRELNFEKKVILIAHLATMFFCFFPWFEADQIYDAKLVLNAFSGPGFLIGYLIFLISLVLSLYFIDRLFESERVALPFKENTVFYAASIQQIILIVLAWSVLFATGKDYADQAIRFGIFLAFVAQIAALVATFLNSQLDQKQQVRSFFRHPDELQQ